MDIQISFGIVATYTIYAALISSQILGKTSVQPLKVGLLFLALLVSAVGFDLIDMTALGFIALFAAAASLTGHSVKVVSVSAWLAITILALAFAMHRVPGFHNALLFHSEGLGTSSLPYSLWANLDKAIAAVMIIWLMRGRINATSWKEFRRADLLIMAVGISAILLLGYALGLQLDLKFGQLTIAFFFFNFFITCIAEEAFFRLLVQDSLQRWIKGKYAGFTAWTVSAMLFTLAHFHTGPGAAERLLLIFLAGLLYAGIYWRSRSFLTAVLTHFLLNFLHLTFFTYPASF